MGSIELTIPPEWNEIETARIEVDRFLTSRGLAGEVVQALTMVVSELMENGIKYGCFEDLAGDIKISLTLDPDRVTIEVCHPVAEQSRDNLLTLDRTIQWIRGYQNPFEAYTERLKEVARKSFEDLTSGLGLVRIAYEGRAILDFFVDEDDVLEVSAVLPVNQGV